MKKQLLLGTTNPGRVSILRSALAPLPQVLSLADLGIAIDVKEDGAWPEENAEKKARAYWAVSGLPTLATDGALHIKGLPAERQPGVFLRRIPGVAGATDEEVLDYYERQLERLGGEGVATWSVGMALAISGGRIVTGRFSIERLMRAGRRGRLVAGVPLDCLMLDPVSGKYYSEMAHEGRPDSARYREFVEQYLSEL
jgi:inosine/xanthosine triphosphate pyrophosphatase family protein